MKCIPWLMLLSASCAWTQAVGVPAVPAAPVAEKGDTVIAIFEDGIKLTVDQFNAILPGLPPNFQQLARQDRERFLHYYAMQRNLALMAEKDKLDQRSPYKEALDYARMSTLTDIMVKEKMNSIVVPPEEIEKFYNEHKDPYKQVKVSAIYVGFGEGEPGAPAANDASTMASRAPKKSLTEDEAKAKAAKLVTQARAGEDFKKLVKENSDDETSRDKSGDFGTWRISENVPEIMRNTVFSLKEGEVSEPVRQAKGYYVFRADQISYTPLDQVRDSLFEQLKQQHAREWMQTVDASTKVVYPGKNNDQAK